MWSFTNAEGRGSRAEGMRPHDNVTDEMGLRRSAACRRHRAGVMTQRGRRLTGYRQKISFQITSERQETMTMCGRNTKIRSQTEVRSAELKTSKYLD